MPPLSADFAVHVERAMLEITSTLCINDAHPAKIAWPLVQARADVDAKRTKLAKMRGTAGIKV